MMKLLVLTSSRYAPTYNEKIISQVDYINRFEHMSAELYNDLPLHEIEEKIVSRAYDCVFPSVVFDYTHEDQFPFSFNTALYNILLYHNQEYIGSDVYTQMLLNDKALSGVRSGMGLPSLIVTRVLWENKRSTAIQFIKSRKPEWPVIVKPNTLSASLGITPDSIVFSIDELEVVIDNQFRLFPGLSEVLLEKYLESAREYTVSITGNGKNVITCATAMIPKSGSYQIYSFASKNLPAENRPLAYGKVEDTVLKKRLEECGRKLTSEFGLRDYSRFDFLVNERKEIYLIDANTIPSLGKNYMHEYTSDGTIRIEQLLSLLLYVVSKRSDIQLTREFINSLPFELLRQLDG